MAFNDSYPKLEQWLMFGGALSMYSIGDGVIKVEIGDSDGLADEHVFECESIDEGLTLAEQAVTQLIEEADDLRAMYMSGDVKSVDQEVIRITGVPPIRNPLYDETLEESAD